MFGVMDTPWGHLSELDLANHVVCRDILAADKHQLLEGLIAESLFDQILARVPGRDSNNLVAVDVETAVVDTRHERGPDRWLAFVWARTRGAGLRRYLDALQTKFRTWYVSLDRKAGEFLAQEWRDGRLQGDKLPLPQVARFLSGREAAPVSISRAVRDELRQQQGFWGYLSSHYGPDLGDRVVLPRLFLNHGIQPWFRRVWNVDRVFVHGAKILHCEIKHKFPISGGQLTFGINDGELLLIGRLASAGVGCLHTVIVKPDWSKDRGSMYLVNDLRLKNRAAIIATTIDHDRVAGLLASTQYTSGRHTSFTGNTDVGYRVIPVSDFSRIGALADPVDALAARIAGMMTGVDIPEQATDNWLREMRARP